MKIEFIYFEGCPNHEPALNELKAAIDQLKIIEKIKIWNSEDPSSPERASHYGSPTILIDEKDLFGAEPSPNPSCRLYGSLGYPTKDKIVRRLGEPVAGGNSAC